MLKHALEFSYEAGQTINLLALRLQWFKSTPTQASPRTVLQVFKQFGGQFGISSLIGFDVVGKGRRETRARLLGRFTWG